MVNTLAKIKQLEPQLGDDEVKELAGKLVKQNQTVQEALSDELILAKRQEQELQKTQQQQQVKTESQARSIEQQANRVDQLLSGAAVVLIQPCQALLNQAQQGQQPSDGTSNSSNSSTSPGQAGGSAAASNQQASTRALQGAESALQRVSTAGGVSSKRAGFMQQRLQQVNAKVTTLQSSMNTMQQHGGAFLQNPNMQQALTKAADMLTEAKQGLENELKEMGLMQNEKMAQSETLGQSESQEQGISQNLEQNENLLQNLTNRYQANNKWLSTEFKEVSNATTKLETTAEKVLEKAGATKEVEDVEKVVDEAASSIGMKSPFRTPTLTRDGDT